MTHNQQSNNVISYKITINKNTTVSNLLQLLVNNYHVITPSAIKYYIICRYYNISCYYITAETMCTEYQTD